MCPIVHCGTVHSSQNMEPRCPWTDGRAKKLWCIHTMEDYSAITRNTFESVLMRWMNLEPLIQSEEQKEKGNCRALKHLCGVWENGAEGFTSRQQWRSRRGEQTRGRGRGRRGETRGESHMDACTTECKTDGQRGCAVCLRKLKRGLYINPEGWDVGSGEGGSRGRGCVYAYG